MKFKKADRVVLVDDWNIDEDAADAVDASPIDPSLRGRRRVVRFALVFIVLGFFGFLFQGLMDVTKPDASVESAQSARAVRAATAAMNEWLTAEPQPVPGGEVVAVGAAPVVDIGTEDDSDLDYETRLVEFTVVDDLNQRYSAQVLVALDPRGSSLVIGTPSLFPIPPDATDSWGPSSEFPGLSAASVTDPVERAIGTWAAAFTSGDPEALRQVVGDGDETHMYVPLNGAKVESVEPGAAAEVDEDGTVILVRVEVQFTWVNVPTGDDLRGLPAVTYDLLIEHAGTAAPTVVAWGPPGTGPALVRHGNAVDAAGRETADPPKREAPTTPAAPPPATQEAQQAPQEGTDAEG